MPTGEAEQAAGSRQAAGSGASPLVAIPSHNRTAPAPPLPFPSSRLCIFQHLLGTKWCLLFKAGFSKIPRVSFSPPICGSFYLFWRLMASWMLFPCFQSFINWCWWARLGSGPSCNWWVPEQSVKWTYMWSALFQKFLLCCQALRTLY